MLSVENYFSDTSSSDSENENIAQIRRELRNNSDLFAMPDFM